MGENARSSNTSADVFYTVQRCSDGALFPRIPQSHVQWNRPPTRGRGGEENGSGSSAHGSAQVLKDEFPMADFAESGTPRSDGDQDGSGAANRTPSAETQLQQKQQKQQQQRGDDARPTKRKRTSSPAREDGNKEKNGTDTDAKENAKKNANAMVKEAEKKNKSFTIKIGDNHGRPVTTVERRVPAWAGDATLIYEILNEDLRSFRGANVLRIVIQDVESDGDEYYCNIIIVSDDGPGQTQITQNAVSCVEDSILRRERDFALRGRLLYKWALANFRGVPRPSEIVPTRSCDDLRNPVHSVVVADDNKIRSWLSSHPVRFQNFAADLQRAANHFLILWKWHTSFIYMQAKYRADLEFALDRILFALETAGNEPPTLDCNRWKQEPVRNNAIPPERNDKLGRIYSRGPQNHHHHNRPVHSTQSARGDDFPNSDDIRKCARTETFNPTEQARKIMFPGSSSSFHYPFEAKEITYEDKLGRKKSGYIGIANGAHGKRWTTMDKPPTPKHVSLSRERSPKLVDYEGRKHVIYTKKDAAIKAVIFIVLVGDGGGSGEGKNTTSNRHPPWAAEFLPDAHKDDDYVVLNVPGEGIWGVLFFKEKKRHLSKFSASREKELTVEWDM